MKSNQYFSLKLKLHKTKAFFPDSRDGWKIEKIIRKPSFTPRMDQMCKMMV